jgi:hypothetical protein
VASLRGTVSHHKTEVCGVYTYGSISVRFAVGRIPFLQKSSERLLCRDPPPQAFYSASRRVTDGTRTRALRSHNPMPSVTVRPSASGNCAYLHGFRGSGTGLSGAYRPVPARLQYGCSSGYHSISPRHTPLVLSFCTEERYHYSYKVLVLAFVSIELTTTNSGRDTSP